MPDYAFIGFGEAATAFVTNWNADALSRSRGYDLKSDERCEEIAKRYADFGVTECFSTKEAVEGSDVVFSLVTADQAEQAANDALVHCAEALYLDCNSCSPATKRRNRDSIEAAGGRYVDVAVMSPVHPALNKVPLLMSGPHAVAASDILLSLDMNPTVLEGEVGTASSVKMVRSILVKGFEAVLAECALAGVRSGVDQKVLHSLSQTYPEFQWAKRTGYMLERMMEHGIRRAAEMREVARTIEELDLPNDMTKATVNWQQRIGDLDVEAGDETDYRVLADTILNEFKGG